jgi:hypothetical protein
MVFILFGCPIYTSQSYAKNLCTGNDATLECLIKNAEELKKSNRKLFWDIVVKAGKKAQDCTTPTEVSRFMEIVRIRLDGALMEFFSEKIEKLCISNAKCFFEALERLNAKDQKKVIEIISNPLFVDQSAITEVFNKNNKKYKKIFELYLNSIEKTNNN